MYPKEYLSKNCGVEKLREIMRNLGGTPGAMNKGELVENILKIQSGEIKPTRNTKGRKPRTDGQEDNQQIDYPQDDFGEGLVLKEGETVGPVEVDERENNGVQGVVEFHEQGYGFLRGENYEPNKASDIFVSQSMINKCQLRRGDYIEGFAENSKNADRPSLEYITKLNGRPLREVYSRPYFDDLTACYPEERLKLELKNEEDDLSIRAIDLLAPIGKGQRGLIVAPPKAGKTTLLKKIANSISVNSPSVKLIMLLIDERPEEVTDLKRFVKGEVVYSTFDEMPEHHVRTAELVLNRAKRLVEIGEDVVILLDSITKLARAYNSIVPTSGKTLSGGLDPLALQAPKKFFGSARNIENGGSLTILSTALVETGSKMDDVIYEEFKGTGNMEIILSRSLSERRIFPAIDLYRSGTRKDELLLDKDEQNAVYQIRRMLDKNANASETLLEMLKKTKSNVEFVEKTPVWCKMITEQL